MVKSFMLKGFSQMVITIVVIGFTISLMDKVNIGGWVNVLPLEIGFMAKQWGKMDGDGTYTGISGTAWSSTSLDLKPSTFDPREKYWTRFTTEGSKITLPHPSREFK
ncbi:hypothetical protein EJD97_021360 [Solanum chilense]|uniref:Uncharacterized protein n=1 Tax=Solanum chilense TaxID=4083 RepID=A0A6N2B3D8_SOLCI|nr:hypothetical protein EJD97_021360 [Solanum chilense]